MDIAALTAPLSEDNPAGEDLSYSAERALIEQAFDTASDENAEPVAWRDIINLIEAEAGKTRDVWLAVYFMRASAQQGNFENIVLGAQLLHALLDSLWDSVHPTIAEYGFQGRKAPCDSLVGYREFLLPLKRMPLVTHERLGSFSSEDIENFLESGGGAADIGQFRSAVEDLGKPYFEELVARLDGLRQLVEQVDAILVERAGSSESGTAFDRLYLQLSETRKALVHFAGLGVEEETPAETAQEAAPTANGDAVAPRQGLAGKIANRDEVIKALDLIIDYYRNYEPGSPIPVSLMRVRGWVNLDFLRLIEDIVPRSLEDARAVLASKQND
ncbi:type VI secretion system ImpA family N-terminal domain-containing protein [Novosphingobium sp. PC22D]|uniref:type VI secretion system protein TssA n=1 Tax=Novosphingobium sp. PC22D TaxID=1962403 RepID=UPI00143AF33D|nr:type VI secretion system ImpA family N-terminal domain-containing protein [Novosphingobium sp. PC22D]